ncbi:MAG: hypothetical protein GC161_06580 [Planctomycetaceae bacterium]|nr:hypothetical protein [Planctomycetaceae bacterium]
MPKWNVTIQPETDRMVRVFLARTGLKKGDLSAFVEEAVRSEILRRQAEALRETDPGLSNEEAIELARDLAALDRGVQDMRTRRGQPMKQALREIADELGLQLDR